MIGCVQEAAFIARPLSAVHKSGRTFAGHGGVSIPATFMLIGRSFMRFCGRCRHKLKYKYGIACIFILIVFQSFSLYLFCVFDRCGRGWRDDDSLTLLKIPKHTPDQVCHASDTENCRIHCGNGTHRDLWGGMPTDNFNSDILFTYSINCLCN